MCSETLWELTIDGSESLNDLGTANSFLGFTLSCSDFSVCISLISKTEDLLNGYLNGSSSYSSSYSLNSSSGMMSIIGSEKSEKPFANGIFPLNFLEP